MKISVCMATYGGRTFVRQQLDSILPQIGSDDEIVIVDDSSPDDTVAVIEGYDDGRIRLIRNSSNLGVNETFARAMQNATGEIIMFADQDDVWCEDRVAAMLAPFEESTVNVVAANHALIDADGRVLPGSLAPMLSEADDQTAASNIARIFLGRMNYYGCAMAIRASFREVVLPYPPKMECHDIWIGMLGVIEGSIRHLPTVVLQHRIHGQNASIIKRPLMARLRARLYLLGHVLVAKNRLWRANSTEQKMG